MYQFKDLLINISKVVNKIMKQILTVIESYLRRFPAPSSIEMISNSLLKLNYTFTIPYTNSKTPK